MQRKRLAVFLFVAVTVCAAVPVLFGQDAAQAQTTRLIFKGYFVVRRPAQAIDAGTLEVQSAMSATIPLWRYSVDSSRDGNHYEGVIVGRDPFNNPGGVSVVTNVVPLIIRTREVGVSINTSTGTITTQPGTTTFNPEVADNACLKGPNNIPITLFQQSPIFQPATFDFGGTLVGKTQYIDALQRGSFWKVLGSNVDDYHVLLKPTFLAPIIINAPAKYGLALTPAAFVGAFGPPAPCGPEGVIDINWFDAYLTNTIIPALAAKGVNPTTFPLFVTYNVVWASPVTNAFACCTLGYHSVTGLPTPTQTYAATDFGSFNFFPTGFRDTAIASHEVAEWTNDPFTLNEVPPWGHVGQQPGCQNNLEVGDPLTATEAPRIVMSNGFTYHLQELTFFSWFFGAPSVGINGWYSDNGTFLTDAGPPCS